jgi:LPS-assembly protein
MIRSRILSAVIFLLMLASPSFGFAQPREEDSGPGPTSTARSRLPGGIELEAESIQQTESGDLVLEGSPTLRWKESRFQADRIVLREERYVEAEGNVLAVWSGNRIAGTRMTYDLERDQGVIEDAIGQVEPEFFFVADQVEKRGEDRLFLDSATITTCTQPVPYWSFSVSSAKIRIDHYARMWNLRLRASRLPIFYLPYMVWPVKKDRSAGLLFPEFGSTRDRGEVISQAVFVPLGPSADVTLVGEFYTIAGFGGGGDVRFIPNREGYGNLSTFYIQDEVERKGRWRASYKQTQRFQNGFRMTADINQVSDFDYFSDFERDIRLVSSPTIMGRLEFARNGKWTSVNVRDFRREQLVGNGTLVQQTLPEIEWRGRSTRLGKSPFYLSYESSLASIQQRGPTIDADYIRGDLFPTVSAPVSPLPWLDVNPQVGYRMTYYTQRRDPSTGEIVDGGLARGTAGGGLEIVGPKLYRIFKRKGPDGEKQYKHNVEARVTYGFREPFDRTSEVISYDEVDLIPARNLLTFGIRSRLFAKRPRAAPTPPPGSGEAILMPDGEASPLLQPEAALAPVGSSFTMPASETGPAESVEIATLEVTQQRAIDDYLSCADLDGDGFAEELSRYSNVQITGRLNPSRALSFDLRGGYHALYRHLQDLSLSGNVRKRRARVGFSLVRREGRGCGVSGTEGFPRDGDDSTQLRLNTGLTLLGGKLRLDFDGSYNADPGPGTKSFPDRRLRIEYYTQCCGFLAEYLARDYTVTSRQEVRFTVDLRGIGKFLDLHHGEDR